LLLNLSFSSLLLLDVQFLIVNFKSMFNNILDRRACPPLLRANLCHRQPNGPPRRTIVHSPCTLRIQTPSLKLDHTPHPIPSPAGLCNNLQQLCWPDTRPHCPRSLRGGLRTRTAIHSSVSCSPSNPLSGAILRNTQKGSNDYKCSIQRLTVIVNHNNCSV